MIMFGGVCDATTENRQTMLKSQEILADFKKILVGHKKIPVLCTP